ncbi:hypothetical protein AOLI_G00011280 [Acnodon oligacanthus]
MPDSLHKVQPVRCPSQHKRHGVHAPSVCPTKALPYLKPPASSVMLCTLLLSSSAELFTAHSVKLVLLGGVARVYCPRCLTWERTPPLRSTYQLCCYVFSSSMARGFPSDEATLPGSPNSLPWLCH